MLSYRHAFHAGNHADVLKHAVLVHLLDYLKKKEKPFWYVDTHAGAAAYALDEAWAQKNAEFATGIGRLWARRDVPASLARYMDEVRALNPDGELHFYPGSAQIAMQMLREQDRLAPVRAAQHREPCVARTLCERRAARSRPGGRRLRRPEIRAAAAVSPRDLC